jgi:hypothetical protein
LDKFATELISRLEQSADAMEKDVHTALQKSKEKKDFAGWLKGKEHDALYWKLFKGENAREAMLDYVTKVLNAKKGWEKLKTLVGSILVTDLF